MAREGTPTDTGLYLVIEKHLKRAGEPLTCIDLYDKADVRNAADSANKVSDALGHLWRRGYLKRTPSPKTPHNQAKWAYTWPDTKAQIRTPPSNSPSMPNRLSKDLPPPGVHMKDGGRTIEIELPQMSVIIKMK